MSNVSFTVLFDDLTPFVENTVNEMDSKEMEVLMKTGKNLLNEAQKLAQERLKQPGTYLTSFKVKVEKDSVTLTNTHRAAQILEFGTKKKGYRIPREGEGLWFFKEGEWKWRPFVIHPGIDAKKIMVDAFDKINPELLKDLKELVGC